ncbi:UDP-N-acetylglucosamine 2-epimerase (non-hydrolyzing) [Micromonospora sp. WMMD1102]|uniref:non-hydrolyzing UDP-N-acetylglucosamine 2-epimerase n=1 Tax=Micromonospora sp. WMMD1102 TaxID=3016105 RepID=UPI00241510DE|nr:UDP-N-acetylglucosamine 2-epimerase (non-hydrolyzing) [Micromonospora sp. WMMD1102]MDG4786354.1 UDP-N-acetylglucosamine 2-epimerase (non-hydrolyzing) [Micromonospora sp. WMMD1102]
MPDRNHRPEIILLAGTRPEGVKLAPLVMALRQDDRFTAALVDAGQHPAQVTDALAPFGLAPDEVLFPVRRDGSLAELAAALIAAVDAALARRDPAAVVVQGDTLTALIGGLVAYWRGIPLVHLEAGLRTHNPGEPFPEEANRTMLARLAELHLAPTETARRNLVAEGVPAPRVVVTGNTVVDALDHLVENDLARPPAWLEGNRPVVVATMHRRENWGQRIRDVCTGLVRVNEARPDVQLVVVLHPNPVLAADITAALSGRPAVRLVPAMSYPEMIGLLLVADVVLTDSGGIQEEAATIGAPLLVTRDRTERPEALADGRGRLVGTNPDDIADAVVAQLRREPKPALPSPFGDGRAASRAVPAIAGLLSPALVRSPVTESVGGRRDDGWLAETAGHEEDDLDIVRRLVQRASATPAVFSAVR